jgi:hypothetical protein
MPGMWPWLRKILFAVGLLGFLATIALWTTASWFLHTIAYVWPDGSTVVVTSGPHDLTFTHSPDAGVYVQLVGGRIGFNAISLRYGEDIMLNLDNVKQLSTETFSLQGSVTITLPYPDRGLRGFLGFSRSRAISSSQTSYTIPFWFIVLLFAIWPAVRVARWVRRCRRYTAGRCQVCGYDLRATPDRCPECGTVVTS